MSEAKTVGAVDPCDVALRLSRRAYNVMNEAELQEAVNRALRADWPDVDREHMLGPKDRPDFLVGGSTVVECKVDGSSNDVVRQLHRYSGYDCVTGIVLVTTRRKHRVPPELGGVPVAVVVVGGAF